MIRTHPLFSRGETILVGVSGGLDSTVLLQVLFDLSQTWDWQLVVGHFNHQLRGRNSDGDESFVRRRAAELGLRCRVGRADVRRLAAHRRWSIEMAARHSRHAFFARTARAVGASRVALAHHGDDQIELFFLRLLRGSSLDGLCGMKLVSPSPADHRTSLVRPFLEFSRGDLEAFAENRHLRYRRDATNQDTRHERNRVRHELLPFLRDRFQAGVDENIRRTLVLLRSEAEVVSRTLEVALKLPRPFADLETALQRRWLLRQCLTLGLEADFALIEQLRLQPDHPVSIGPSQVAWRTAAGQVQREHTRLPRFRPDRVEIQMRSDQGEVEFGGLDIRWRVIPWQGWPGGAPQRSAGLERFDAAKVGRKIQLRHWQPGDRFQPIGMKAEVKLQDLFVNQKVPRRERMRVVLGETGKGEIFWVHGFRIGERFRIENGTEVSLEWSWANSARTGG